MGPLSRFVITLAISLIAVQGSAAARTNRGAISELSQKKWVAVSTTAMSITGDIKISSAKLNMVGGDYPLTIVREIGAKNLNDAGKIVDVIKPTGRAFIRPKFLRERSLSTATPCVVVTKMRIGCSLLLRTAIAYR